MKITKTQLRKIIKEERIKLLREYDEADTAPPTNGEHHWPRVDWSNVGELVDKWAKMEEDAWDTGDTSMNPDDVSNADAKREWGHQVENGAMDMEAELTLRIRKVALQTMQEFTDKLVNGEYA